MRRLGVEDLGDLADACLGEMGSEAREKLGNALLAVRVNFSVRVYKGPISHAHTVPW